MSWHVMAQYGERLNRGFQARKHTLREKASETPCVHLERFVPQRPSVAGARSVRDSTPEHKPFTHWERRVLLEDSQMLWMVHV